MGVAVDFRTEPGEVRSGTRVVVGLIVVVVDVLWVTQDVGMRARSVEVSSTLKRVSVSKLGLLRGGDGDLSSVGS